MTMMKCSRRCRIRHHSVSARQRSATSTTVCCAAVPLEDIGSAVHRQRLNAHVLQGQAAGHDDLPV